MSDHPWGLHKRAWQNQLPSILSGENILWTWDGECPVGPYDVIRAVAEQWDTVPSALLGRSRSAADAHPRFAVMWILKRRFDMSNPKIGKIFQRDHTSVMHAVKRADGWIAENNPQFVGCLKATLTKLGLGELEQ